MLIKATEGKGKVWDGVLHICEGCKIVAVDPSHLFMCDEGCEGKGTRVFDPKEDPALVVELIDQVFQGDAEKKFLV